jgi:nucleotide-binding universal stress UspA family protein
MNAENEPQPAAGSTPEPAPEAAAAAEYILVALDLSPHSEAALAAAAELAAVLHLELRGLYVEDVNLLRLCGLPFGIEFGTFTARPRRIEQTHLEREFRIQATQLRKIMADVAGQRRIAWSFQVVRGAVTDQLLAASAAARMLSLGRVGRSPGKRTGSTAQAIAQSTQRPVVLQSRQRRVGGPFFVVYTGSEASAHALALGVQLAVQEQSALTVLVYADLDWAPLVQAAQAGGVEPTLQRAAGLPDLLAELRGAGSVILPVDAAAWLDAIPLTVIVTP